MLKIVLVNLDKGLLGKDAAGNWGEARIWFRRAHELSPTARTFRSLGLCDFELRHYVEAIEEFEASLKDERRPLTAELRQQVEQTLERSRQYVARYTLHVPGPVQELEVDGKSRPLPPQGELLLNPGAHSITVRLAAAPAITAYRGTSRFASVEPTCTGMHAGTHASADTAISHGQRWNTTAIATAPIAPTTAAAA